MAKQSFHVQTHSKSGEILCTAQYEYASLNNFIRHQVNRKSSYFNEQLPQYPTAHEIKVFEQATHGDSWYLLKIIKVGDL